MIRATGHFVLIDARKLEKVTQGGIVIPDHVRDTDQGHADIGTVLDVGPTAYKADGLGGEPWVKVGDKVFYARYSGKVVQEPDSEDKFLIVNDNDIMGVVVENREGNTTE